MDDEMNDKFLSDEEIEELLNCISENTYKKTEKIKYYDFKRPERLSHDDLEGNKIFGLILAENLVKELKKKFCNYISNLHAKLFTLDELTFEEFYRSMPNYTAMTSFEWNKNDVLFEMDSDVNCALLNNFIQVDEKDLRNREMTESEIKLYKKNIESCVLKALIRSCKKNKAYKNNSIKRPIFTKKEFTNYYYNSLNHIRYKSYESGCLFTIELFFNTPTDFINSTFNLFLEWKLAKQIADNITGKKKKRKKISINNQIDKKECFVEAKLGNTTMSLSDVKDINKDSLIDFEQSAFEPLTIYVDGKEFAKGEVVVREKSNNFSLRVTELL